MYEYSVSCLCCSRIHVEMSSGRKARLIRGRSKAPSCSTRTKSEWGQSRPLRTSTTSVPRSFSAVWSTRKAPTRGSVRSRCTGRAQAARTLRQLCTRSSMRSSQIGPQCFHFRCLLRRTQSDHSLYYEWIRMWTSVSEQPIPLFNLFSSVEISYASRAIETEHRTETLPKQQLKDTGFWQYLNYCTRTVALVFCRSKYKVEFFLKICIMIWISSLLIDWPCLDRLRSRILPVNYF